jgi:ABC-type transport system involved in cytochrome bd biosynthesis fused ATPase/permease subunit
MVNSAFVQIWRSLTSSVPDWVSSLKRIEIADPGSPKIGFENASYRWNSGKQTEAASANGNGTALPAAGPSSPTSSGDATVFESAEAYFRLSDLNVDFPIGRLTVVTGPTGSGKTAILTALLGEMEQLEGKGFLPKHPTVVDEQGLRNSVAYAAQTPWLQQKSIKDNILFGEEYDEKRYEATIEACAL